MNKLLGLIYNLINALNLRKGKYYMTVLCLSLVVVFAVTYMLILPGNTLSKDTASEMGGIDVPAAEQNDGAADDTIEDQSSDTTAVQENAEVNNTDITDEPDTDQNTDETDTDSSADSNADITDNAEKTDSELAQDQDVESSGLVFEGEGYTVSVNDPQNILPEGTVLSVSEITDEDKKYDQYCSDALEALQKEADAEVAADQDAELNFVRLYDIKLIAGEQVIEPSDTVEVTITYDQEDKLSTANDDLKVINEDNVYVVHFAKDEQTGEEQAQVLDPESASFSIHEKKLEEATFKADSFSVYAIVEAPEPEVVDPVTVDDVTGIEADTAYLMSVTRAGQSTEYFQNTLNGNSAFVVTSRIEEGSEWYLESDGNGKYYIYTLIDGQKKYVKNNGNNASLVDTGGTLFQVTDAAAGKFFFKVNGQNLWLQYSNSGSGIRFYNANNNVNSHIALTLASSITMEDDPYDLGGKTYGIAYQNGTTTAAAMTATGKTSGSQSRLAAEELTIRPDILEHKSILLADEGKDMVEWTFESVSEDKYYITTMVDGQKKYLTINRGNVTLADEPDGTGKSLIKVVPGTGDNEGKYSFLADNYYLNLQNTSVTEGFNSVSPSRTSSWLNLVEKTALNDEDFIYYTARKVSVSDTDKVKDGDQIVLYTRIWNSDTMRYDFYAVDHDGKLFPCRDTGDSIEWIGSNVQSFLWDFTEYTNTDGTLNYYYELQNSTYGNYIAPQLSVGENGQVFSDDPIGINLNGRKNGENYTSIIAWDENQYTYSGLKAEDGKIVPCTLSEADDFFFAIIHTPDPEEPLSEVNTVDNDRYGITMKMINFPESDGRNNNRDDSQTAFFGRDTDSAGMLSTDLNDDGYPTGTGLIPGNGQPLSDLFTSALLQDANHLFLQSIYNESGYFEYDSTQNFAHFDESSGNFTVYDQLAAIDGSTRATRTHGQFMPYNDIDPDDIITEFSNLTDVTATELPDTDPRKGEDLYRIKLKDADYFFGMEMEATFTQTANGHDAWGHDIIFEFSGDDDFWFYVDGELVLDLGGVHSATSGSINFCTGEIKTTKRGNSTLYETFRQNYQARGMSEAEIASKLDELFKLNENGQYVFKDYTNHTMKMFYMERGAGASNLHMRFNLAAVEPGAFLLSKKLSGTDDPANDLIEFPYQVYYTDTENVEHLLGLNPEEVDGVTYKDTTTKVRHEETYTPAGGTDPYQHVFFLKPGQAAQVKLPEGAVKYRVVECGVNPDVYDEVYVNKTEPDDPPLTGTPTANKVGDTARRDYDTGDAALENRQRVDFDNHVSEGAMRTLSFTKKLYDTDGLTLLTPEVDNTPFSFRLYLGNESADAADIPPAHLYKYYVKDSNGSYCKWDAESQSFIPLEISSFADLTAYLNDESTTAAERDAIIFITSPNGSISKIPADHTIEVRDLIVDTKYKIEERHNELPKGYTLRMTDGYTRTDGGEETYGTEPVVDEIKVNEDPKYEIRNQKAWGLTVKKVWTDKDVMESHGDAFFAVYVVKNGNHEVLLENYVKALRNQEDEVYFLLDTLDVDGVRYTFNDFVIREVELEGSHTIGEDGYVTGFSNVHPIAEGQPIHISGKPIGGTEENIKYTVYYQPGSSTGHNENVRIDTVTNSRPGIMFYKTEWDWETELAGAKFRIKNEQGQDVIQDKIYTSNDTDGLITTAYLTPGTYTLEEIETPRGYVAMDEPLTFTVEHNHHTVTIDPDNEYAECIHQAGENARDMTVIKIRNRKAGLAAVKLDAETSEGIEGVHFALYRQVESVSGELIKDHMPIEGFSDLITAEGGTIPKIDLENLKPGTYYLDETQPAAGYDEIDDVCLTIGADGHVSIQNHDNCVLDQHYDKQEGRVDYTLKVINGKMKKVSFMKVDMADTAAPLAGAEFDLYSVTGEGDDAVKTLIMSGLTSDANGMLALVTKTQFELPIGTYELEETKAPSGYDKKESPVIIHIKAGEDTESADYGTAKTLNGVDYDEGTDLSADGKGLKYDSESKVYTMKITNTSGVELPQAGGIGTTIFYVLGSILILGCGIVLAARKRMEGHK